MRDPKTSGCGSAQALLRLPEDEAGSSPEQVELDSSSLLPQSLSPSQSQRLGMQRLFLHLKRSEGQVCWSGGGGKHTQDLPFIPNRPSSMSNEEKSGDRKALEPQTRGQDQHFPPILELEEGDPGCPNHRPHTWGSLSPNPTAQPGSLTAELGCLIAVIQAVVVAITFPAFLDAAIVLAGELPRLALGWGDVGRVGCPGESTGRVLTR